MGNKLLLSFLCVTVLILGGCDGKSQQVQIDQLQLEPLSTTFIREDRKIKGKENRIGVLGPEFIAGESSKQMWVFWGELEEFPIHLTIRVIGLNLTTNEVSPVLSHVSVNNTITPIWEMRGLAGSIYGARHHSPSNMQINKPGRWKIFVFFDDKLFDSIVIEVKEPEPEQE